MRISDLFITISKALDMGDIEILDHSRRVAYISLELAKRLNLANKKINEVVLTALISDIGIMSTEDKVKAQNVFNLDEGVTESHSKDGYELTKNLKILPNIPEIILHHHHKWSGNNFDGVKGEDIPLASRIIFLADRIEALIEEDKYILFQVNDIITAIESQSDSWFDPNIVDAFLELANKEFFWLILSTGEYSSILELWGEGTEMKIDLDDLESVASIVAKLIDRISPFTSRHSTGVATIAAMLTHELAFNQLEQRAMRIAGLFHDLGKLIIPKEIIEKKGELNDEEYKIIQQHSFYSFRLLNKINGLGDIPEWAALHHERLDGNGYPFHYDKNTLNTGSKIMAVSDVFQALTEDRPYRKAFSIAQAIEIIDDMKFKLKFDKDIVNALKDSI